MQFGVLNREPADVDTATYLVVVCCRDYYVGYAVGGWYRGCCANYATTEQADVIIK